MGHAAISITADTYGHLFPRGDDGAELAAAEKAFLGANTRVVAAKADPSATLCPGICPIGTVSPLLTIRW